MRRHGNRGIVLPKCYKRYCQCRVNPIGVYIKFQNIVSNFRGQSGRKDNQKSALFDLLRRTVSFIIAKKLLPNFLWREFCAYMVKRSEV